MYKVDLHDPSVSITFLQSRDVPTRAGVLELLKCTDMNYDQKLIFMRALESDGIAEHTHNDQSGRFYDITAIVEKD